MDKQQAMQTFWESFGIPAYNEVQIPEEADINQGYITYQKIFGDFESTVYPTAAIWTRGTSWRQADDLENRISAALEGGYTLDTDSGHIQINKGSPFSQQITEDQDRLVKGYRLTLQMEFLSAH